MFMDELLYSRKRERERMGRAFYGFCQGNSNLSQRLVANKKARIGGWIGGWVGSVGGERRSWQNLLGSNASPFARIERMKVKCCNHSIATAESAVRVQFCPIAADSANRRDRQSDGVKSITQ